MSLLPTTLLLLAAAPASDSALRLHEGLPPGFQADAKLDEWTQPPSLTLGAAQQVAGERKVASPDDLSATLWLAVGPEGLAIAGEVRDDQLQLTRDGSGDHAEVWLTLPPPKMPPLAFVNQFQEQPVPTLNDCPRKPPKKVAACETWWKQQTERRQQLLDALVAHYAVHPGSTAHFEPFPGGYRFEALIPATAFPRTAEAPLAHLSLRVDVVDGDAGAASRGTRLSSSPTFQTAALSKPLRFGQWPELLERALKAHPGASYQPGADADSLEVWLNPAQAYQYAPRAPSPDVVRVDLSQVKSLAAVGDLELVTVPAEVNTQGQVERWLVSRREQALVDSRNIGNDEIRVAPRAPGAHLVQVYNGPSSLMGTGTCGECPLVSFQHFTMDARGHFSAPQRLEGAGGLTEAPVQWTVSPDLSRIEASDERGSVRHTLDPKTGRYRTRKLQRSQAPPAARDRP
ncbi:hypothetical protein [Myxococcus sp. RHSTA-1-4]|uniref:hypothetical protein n=1 Tax=Myxococcus sp. RHSTA-1-4 TaxID=2874601 RepID=UPI001CBFC16D|nr:hypothetical protein [Myxococcus sp. RHSTA-1-4]MBZ4417870.1 hypothetical protein [Myxococcus sp. RHSTA-1-4]